MHEGQAKCRLISKALRSLGSHAAVLAVSERHGARALEKASTRNALRSSSSSTVVPTADAACPHLPLTGFVVVSADARGRRCGVNRRYRPPFARLVGTSQDAVRRGFVLGGAPGASGRQGLSQPDGAPHSFLKKGREKKRRRRRCSSFLVVAVGVVGASSLLSFPLFSPPLEVRRERKQERTRSLSAPCACRRELLDTHAHSRPNPLFFF